MYSIGRFSKLTGVSTKTLIWYDQVGLLKPEKVDIENGYRYYGEESFKRLANIHFWQSMEFSVKEIINLSKEVISEKIDFLQEKIHTIASNIDLLQTIQEGNMENKEISIFEAENRLSQGKWRYVKSSTNFKDILDIYTSGKKDKDMPKFLFFGDGNLGTDLKETFGYSGDCLTLQDYRQDKEEIRRGFWFFIINYRNTLVLYEKPKEEDKANKKVEFHIYERENSTIYTTKEIQRLYEKYQQELGAKLFAFNENLIGEWKMYDEITESTIDKYEGKVNEKNACYTMSPIFDCLKISANKEVVVMEEGEELELNGSNGLKIFNPENTKMTVSMSKKSKDEFVINNTLIKEKHNGIYRKIGNEEYLFVNLDNNPDLDEKVYVYKKQ